MASLLFLPTVPGLSDFYFGGAPVATSCRCTVTEACKLRYFGLQLLLLTLLFLLLFFSSFSNVVMVTASLQDMVTKYQKRQNRT